MPVPYLGREFTFTQPDGTYLQVKGWGNQDYAVFETLDGYTVTEDPVTGFYQYATVNDDGDLVPTGYQAERVNPRDLQLSKNLRETRLASQVSDARLTTRKTRWQTRREITRMQKRANLIAPFDAESPPQRQTVGDFVGLCLLVDFPDVPHTFSREEVDDFCNLQGYNVRGNKGSVRDYFFDNSGGKLRYTNIVAPYYTAQHNRDYYTDPSQAYTTRAGELIREALDSLKAQGFDFSPLSLDAGGHVYATNLLYAGPTVNRHKKGLWPHSSDMPDYTSIPGMTFKDYQISNMGTELTLGTFCHENGHMLCDFPDLYDLGFDSHGVGAFCLMCYGLDPNSKNPTQVNAYLKLQAGWANSVTELTPGMNATIHAGVNDFYIFRKSPTEYFIIENRHNTGRDQELRSSGLAIWHVDELGVNNNQQMTPALHYECSLLQADGNFDFERFLPHQPWGDANDLFHAGGNTRFGNATNPHSRWWDGTPSGLEISNISAAGSIMKFTVL
jgi:M6 family metalloprotease-like protein